MADRRMLADLTRYTGRRAKDERTVKVAGKDVTFKLVLTILFGIAPAAVFGLLWVPLLGWWSPLPGLFAEAGWVFALYWISPSGLRQRQWRKWHAKATAANNRILHTGQIVNQRFDQVRRMEPSILARNRPPTQQPGLEHVFGRVRRHPAPGTRRRTPRRLVAHLRRHLRRRHLETGLPLPDRTPPAPGRSWTTRLPATTGTTPSGGGRR